MRIDEGAVLYDTRAPERRECCGGQLDARCLWHVTTVYDDRHGSETLYELWDGTHTVRTYVLEADLLAEFTSAGWSIRPYKKPTYLLTRRCGVDDPHDPMVRHGGDER